MWPWETWSDCFVAILYCCCADITLHLCLQEMAMGLRGKAATPFDCNLADSKEGRTPATCDYLSWLKQNIIKC